MTHQELLEEYVKCKLMVIWEFEGDITMQVVRLRWRAALYAQENDLVYPAELFVDEDYQLDNLREGY